MKPRVRVLLAAHGEAESAGFLDNFQVSRHTLAHAAEVMQLPAPLRLLICSVAGLRKRLKGGPGSPHNGNTRDQAAALQRVLDRDADADYRVDVVFASSPPYLDDALACPEGVDRQVVVSMIPTDSRLSCGLVCHALRRDFAEEERRTAVVARMWDDADLIDVHRDHVVGHFPVERSSAPCCLVLVLHGTVVRDKQGRPPAFHAGVEEKDVYGEALKAALMAVPDRPWQRVELAFLNHGVGGEWSSPTLEALMKQLADEGVQRVVAYPCEHLVDGGETTGLPKVLEATDVPQTHCLPCLNSGDAFIEYLAGRVRAAESDGSVRNCAPCPSRKAAPVGGRGSGHP